MNNGGYLYVCVLVMDSRIISAWLHSYQRTFMPSMGDFIAALLRHSHSIYILDPFFVFNAYGLGPGILEF